MAGEAELDRTMTMSADPDGRLVRVAWIAGTHLTGELAGAAMKALDEFNAGRRRPLLVDMTRMAHMTREARLVFTRECSATRIALVGGSPVDRVIATFALGLSRMAMPIRFFTSEPAALAWLTGDETRT